MVPPDNHNKETPDPSINPRAQKKNTNLLPADAYIEGILEHDRTLLSRAITLIESTKPEHRELSRRIIEACLPHTGDSVRIGITGVPGVGKSTFIEALGNHVINSGRRLAVLAIDPSSTRTRGSILGDKTRMETLATNEKAYIRPSPTSGSLGGVARKTRETIYLCEAAGYNTIFVETVGVGQSETAAHSMVDFFLLLMLAGAGDELQGIKRGIVEMADAIVINKSDMLAPEQLHKATRDFKNALHLFPEPQSDWPPKVTHCSALNDEKVDEVWELIKDYFKKTKENGYFETRRKKQARYWMYETIESRLKGDFYNQSAIRKKLASYEKKVTEGEMSSFKAARELLELYRQSH